jgi:hypothetical protein
MISEGKYPHHAEAVTKREAHVAYLMLFFPLLPPYSGARPILEHRADYSVSWCFTCGRTPWTGDQLRTTQTQKNADTHLTSMPRAGFEHAITASERSKTVHASHRSATATGLRYVMKAPYSLDVRFDFMFHYLHGEPGREPTCQSRLYHAIWQPRDVLQEHNLVGCALLGREIEIFV